MGWFTTFSVERGFMGFFVMFILLIVVIKLHQRAALKKRVKAAYDFRKPNIHGVRKVADNAQLRKAGLL
jgi:hypothetical protein